MLLTYENHNHNGNNKYILSYRIICILLQFWPYTPIILDMLEKHLGYLGDFHNVNLLNSVHSIQF